MSGIKIEDIAFVGFRAPDLAGEAYTQKGAYVRLRFKFDENLMAEGFSP